MKLSTKQQEFTFMQARLVMWAYSKGYRITGGEWFRHQYMQQYYMNAGKTKTLTSKHTSKLAWDLNLFIEKNGVYVYSNPDPKLDGEDYRPLGEYWETLGGKWGGRFGISKKDYAYKIGFDSNHFQY